MLATWVKMLPYSIRLAKQQLFTCSTLFGISRSLSGYRTFPYRNYPRTTTTLNVLISRFIDERERERDVEILEREILFSHGIFFSKTYNLGQNCWESCKLEEHFSKHRSCYRFSLSPFPRKQCCCVFRRKPGPSAFVGSNIELGKVISFHKAAGLEIVLFRRIVHIMGKTLSKRFVQDYSLHKSRVKKNVYIYQQFRVDINKFEKEKNI